MTYRAAVAVALIDQHRCPCEGCNGQLAGSDYPSWRRCQECRCSWRIEQHGARRLAATVAGPCRATVPAEVAR